MNTLSPPGARHARLFALALGALVALALPSTAAAQGRCACNNGCHMYPGQCVQPGASGCETGYAPFCGTRTNSCPHTGWVSCSGDCTCVRIGPGDAGTPDASVSLDVPAGADVPASMDAPIASDRPATGDATTSTDRPLSVTDAPAGGDGATPADGPAPPTDAAVTPTDAAVPAGDGATPEDASCICTGGACVGGLCVTERCTYNPELGFICNRPATTCRVVGAEAYCVPVCLDVRCADGEFCDESSGGRCVRDDCATIRCAAGTTCRHNQCGRFDGGVFFGADGAIGDGGAPLPTGSDDGGCGCRATPTGASPNALWLLACGLVFAGRRRRGARRGRLARGGLLAAALVAGCGGTGSTNDPNTVNFSGPVNVLIDKFKDSDVHNGVFDGEKDINSQTGNPYGTFLHDARAALGRDPAAIVVDRVTLTLGGDSRGVARFEQVFAGEAVVFVRTSTTTINLGSVSMLTGAGPVDVPITAGRAELAPVNAQLLSGQFKVGVRVSAAAGRPSSFEARLASVFYFRALVQ